MSNTRVYFIKSARSNAVKIGVAEDPRKRLHGLQTGSVARLTLIAELPGDERYEKVLHEHFAEYRIRGEWFRCEGRLATFVSLLPAMAVVNTRPPRVREEKPDLTPNPALDKYIKTVVYPLLRDTIVDEIGVDRFAEFVGKKRGDVIRAIHRNGRYIPIEWAMYVMMLSESRLEIANAILEPLGLRALTPEQAAKEREEAARLVLLKAAIVRAVGEEDAQKFFDSIESEDWVDPQPHALGIES